MITREQVADLREGDLVRVTGWYGINIEGRLSLGTRSVWLGPHCLIRDVDGSVGVWAEPESTLTVVSRAPRPLYVNHDRTEPGPGDVVRDADDEGETNSYTYHGRNKYGGWYDRNGYASTRDELPDHLHLLVDGETGQVVP